MTGITKSQLTHLFEKVRDTIQASPTLADTDIVWKAWGSGESLPGNRPPKDKVAIELFPAVDSQEWASADSHKLWFAIGVRMTFASRAASDYLDLFAAIVRAVYPLDRDVRLSLQGTLRDDFGCITGEPQILWPVPSPDLANQTGSFDAQGQIRYLVRWQLNT